jgi:DNA replication and repair protein RecF
LFTALERVGSQMFVTGADPAAFAELGARARLYEVTPGRAQPWPAA